ncbi:MAG TPA: putative Ig domain-containing protein [Steroidobacter sp.]|uniref:putative Ig domain-containing protein n=1 Tax=Steroidobacter sp. TaxID=1978227 RepID=UPI002EDA1C98
MRRTFLPGFFTGCLLLVSVLLAGCGGGGGGGEGATTGDSNAPAPGNSTNAAPTVSGTPGSTVIVGQAYSFQPAAADADGDRLSFTVANLPSWASFNTETGRITGTPTAAQVGSYANITISVSDGTASATLGPFSITVNAVGAGGGSATLSWTPPTENSDGSALTNLAGYEVHYGQNRDSLDQTVRLDNPSLTSYLVENLSSGTWYFAVVAVNSAGTTSPLSNTASKTVS